MTPTAIPMLFATVLTAGALLAQEPATTTSRSAADGAAAYRGVVETLDRWVAKFPALVTKHSIGTSAEGRPLVVLRIGPPGDGHPEMYLGAAIHGGERSEEDAMWLVEGLLARTDDAVVRELLRSRVLWVQPLVNPDGVVARQRTNARGVDLNRNFGGRWKAAKAAAGADDFAFPGAEEPQRGPTYPGPGPFSEPETRAVRDFLRGRPRLGAYLDLHRSAAFVVVPQIGSEGELRPEVEAAGKALCAAMGGAWGLSGPRHFPQLNGLSLDWVFGELAVMAFTWEVRPTETDGSDADPRWKGLLHLLERCAEYARGEGQQAASRAAGSAPPSGRNGAPFVFADAWKEVVLEFREGCERAGVVGGSLMFVRGKEVLGQDTFGLADRERKRAVDRDTNFHWASITKTFTGIALMQLRDRGKLRLDQSIDDFVPELRDVHNPFGSVREINFRHLLSHSSGFRSPTWPWGGDKPWHPHEPKTFEQLIAMMPYTEVQFAPGTKFSYSNPGIVFAARAIERLSGDDYEVYMDKNVLRPLGMLRSYFDITPYHLQRHRSHSYEKKNESVNDLGPDFDTGITTSNGGLNAPLTDMALYLAFLLGAVDEKSDAAAVLSRKSLEEMWQPVVPLGTTGTEHMGLTYFLQQHEGQRFVTHTGGQRSFISFFYVHPASGTGALGAFNTSTAGPVMGKARASCMKKLSLPMTKS